MKLRGIDFGYVMNASSARNFFGQGYPYHRWWRKWGLDYTGSTFVAKTTTLEKRDGFMPLRDDLQPVEKRPACIKVNFRSAAVLNAVGLSGPGLPCLLQQGSWQRRATPFFISFAAVADTSSERLDKWKKFARILQTYMPASNKKIAPPMGLEINPFCPNTGHDFASIEEILAVLDIMSCLQIPLVVKINVLMNVASADKIQQHPACDAICVSNTIPFGKLPLNINWKYLWGSNAQSPLSQFGGGGLSGAPLFWLVAEWIRLARQYGFYKPIIGCGGIICPQNARIMFNMGANAIQLGSVSIVRPWRVQRIIQHANAYAREMEKAR